MNIVTKIKKVLVNNYIKFLQLLVRPDKSILVFYSRPDFSDNSRALFDYIRQNDIKNHYKIYWVVDKPSLYRRFESSSVRFLSLKGTDAFMSIFLICKAGWIFTTHGFFFEKNKTDQKIVVLWHGCSYKEVDERERTSIHDADYYLVPGPLFKQTKSRSWGWPIDRIVDIGYPRYDWFIENSEKTQKLYRDLLMGHKKMIIWMPTFRNDKDGLLNETDMIKQFPILNTDEEWQEFDKYCSEKSIIVFVKLHPKQKDYKINWQALTSVILFKNSYLDDCDVPFYSFLAETDALITDYSSVAIDYLLVDKPIGFTLDDFEKYRNGRGFVFPNVKDYMPGSHLYTINDLKDFINQIANNVDAKKNERTKIKSSLVNYSANYCADILRTLEFEL